MSLRAVPRTKQAAVLCLFDYLATTGFGTVSNNIVAQLRRHFGSRLHLDIVAINYFSKEQFVSLDKDTRVICIPENERANDDFGRVTFLDYLDKGYYTACFIMQDLGTFVGMLPNLEEIRQRYHKAGKKRFKSIAYFPVDSKPLNIFLDSEKTANLMLGGKKLEEAKARHAAMGLPMPEAILNMSHAMAYNLANLDRLVTYTQYGRREILAKRPDLKGRIGVIGHGVNPADFHPEPPREIEAFRRQYFGDNAYKTIITNINRNQYRKDIPTTLLGFKHYLDQYNPEAFLYLHMTPNDVMGWDLRQIGDNLGLIEGEDYGFPDEKMHHAAADISTLRSIYNASDIFLTTTTGEGWGLTVMEAMMCQCPVVAPMHTSLQEICADGMRAWPLVKLSATYFACDDSVQREQCDYIEVAEVLHQAVTHPQDTEDKKQAAYQYTREMTWANICRDWNCIFEELCF